MGLFSSNKSKTSLAVTNVSTDNSANAAEGALAVGSGANVNITTSDAEVALGALATQQNTSIAALQTNQNVVGLALNTADRALAANSDVAGLAISANRDINRRSLDTTSRLAESAINTVAGIGEVASRERIDTLQSANLAVSSAQGATDKFAQLANAALERSQTPDSAVTKQLLLVVGAVAVLAVLLLFGRRRKTA